MRAGLPNSMKGALLAVAIFAGIVVPALTLGIVAVEGWHLPSWLAVSLPVVLFASVRGTVVLLGWRAFRWSLPRFKSWRSRERDADADPPTEVV
jgi:hypothetical protein